jgi:hypothetical protein
VLTREKALRLSDEQGQQKAVASEPLARSVRPASADPPAVGFGRLFARAARRVRLRLALRHMLTGAALGLALATLLALLGWRTRHAGLRAMAPLVGGVGVFAGAVVSRRRRWSDTDVALYLDRRLSTDEAICTAVELESHVPPGVAPRVPHARAAHPAADDAPRAFVVSTASAALASCDPRLGKPSLLKPVHAIAPLAMVVLVGIARAPLPSAPQTERAPGAGKVQLAEVSGLEKAVLLGELDARDEAQKRRLDKIASDAEKLREALKEGIERRDAQDKIAHLRDEVAAERLSLGDGEQRSGFESAVASLGAHDATKRAAEALGDHDLQRMDAQMEKLANERETADREVAKRALEEAARAAAQGGSPDVERALEDEKRLLDARGKRADLLRDLADGLKAAGVESSEVQTESELLDRKESDRQARQLADSLGKALEKLSPDERKRLGEKLRQLAASKQAGSLRNAQTQKDLSDALSTPDGEKQLEEELKQLAQEETESPEAKREGKLDDAEEGAAGAEGEIGKHGREGQAQGGEGQPSDGQGAQGQGGQGQQDRAQGEGQPGMGQGEGQGQGGTPSPIPMPAGDGVGHGGTHDFGTGSHQGQTGPVNADTLKSRAKGPLSKNSAMPGAITTYAPGRAGGTANVRGTGDLRVVGPSEVDGVERSDVPQEYREHVRHYFQP